MSAGSDTTGMSSDTARTGPRMRSDTSGTAGEKSSSAGKRSANQPESRVTDTRTGESALQGVTQTTSDQGQPVTTKGDTIRRGGDSFSH